MSFESDSKHHDMLKSMAPKEAYASASLLRFAQEEPFKSMLVGIAKVTTEVVAEQSKTLPTLDYADFEMPAEDLPAVAVELLRSIYAVERLGALIEWWSENGQAFRDAWAELVLKKERRR